MSSTRAVVTLVHGTFARKARWVEPDSKIRSKLADAGCAVETFRWSGRNSFRARGRAADELRLRLEENHSWRPDLPQIVIAHSHGGNVALSASSQLSGEQPLVITLATPFTFARQRDLGFGFLSTATTAAAFCILSVLVLAFIGPNPRNIGLHWWETFVGGLAVFELLLLGIGMLMHGRPTRTEVRERLIALSQSPQATATHLLAIRAPGDEASGVLISAQFFSWLGGRLVRTAFRTVSTVALLLSLLGIFGGLAVAVFNGPVGVADTLVEVALDAYFGILALSFLATTTLMLPTLAFGIDGPFVSLIALATAESTPPGAHTLVQLSQSNDEEVKGLAHSSLYDNDIAISIILDKIRSTVENTH